MRTVEGKWESTKDAPVSEWRARFTKNWNPKKDFAFAMLHAERLTKILCDEAVADILFAQAKAHPERRAILERHLERAEPRCKYLLDEIQSTGDRLLEELHASEREEQAQAAQ